jgi:hypothetical protein
MPLAVICGSGMLMPCWRMHRANASACWRSWALGGVGRSPFGRDCRQACCAALNFGVSRSAGSGHCWPIPSAVICGSGRLMPCWRVHLAKLGAACLSSRPPLALVVAVGLFEPLRLATPLGALPPPAQAATPTARASAPTSAARCG